MRTLAVILFCVGLLITPAAADDDLKPLDLVEPEAGQTISYAETISEILFDKCVGCHSEALAENGLNMEEFEGLMTGGRTGPAVVPGKSDESLIYLLSAHRQAPAMPPIEKADLKPLTPEELGLLKRWIDDGAKNDTDASAKAPAVATIALGELPPGLEPIVALDITSDGKLTAYGQGNKVRVVDTETGEERASLAAHQDIVQSIRFSPDAKLLAAGSYQVVTLWKVPDDPKSEWESPRQLGPHVFRVLCLDFSPDGKLLATGGGEPSRSGEVKLWNVDSGTLSASYDKLHSDTVFGVRFSPDGKLLASAGSDKFLKVSNVQDGTIQKTFEGHTHHVMAVDWKADGKQLASAGADNVVKVWDLESGEQKKTLDAAGKQVTSLKWLTGKDEVAGAAGDGQARVWNTENGKVTRSYAGAGDYLYAVSATADAKRLVAGGAEGILFVWDLEKGELFRKIAGGTTEKKDDTP